MSGLKMKTLGPKSRCSDADDKPPKAKNRNAPARPLIFAKLPSTSPTHLPHPRLFMFALLTRFPWNWLHNTCWSLAAYSQGRLYRKYSIPVRDSGEQTVISGEPSAPVPEIGHSKMFGHSMAVLRRLRSTAE